MDNHPRVGVGIIIVRGNEVLLIRRKNVHGDGTWSTPGGHLDFGETPEQCGAREAKEETGLDVENVRFRAVTNDVFEGEDRHYVTIWTEGDYAGGEARVNAAHEMSEIGWFPWAQLPTPLFLPFENLLAGRCYPPEHRTSTA